MTWTDRAADRSPHLLEWRSRNARQMQLMVDAALRLINRKGGNFTSRELAQEAGVAVQTFYRYFGGKDQLMLATLEELHAVNAAKYEEGARDLSDPLARLRFYVKAAITALDQPDTDAVPARFITAEHWRLFQLYPEETLLATKPIIDLFVRQLRAAQEQGRIAVADVDQTAELMVMLMRDAFHQAAFKAGSEPAVVAENVWRFCLLGLTGQLPD